jgi:hypothetical protein
MELTSVATLDVGFPNLPGSFLLSLRLPDFREISTAFYRPTVLPSSSVNSLDVLRSFAASQLRRHSASQPLVASSLPVYDPSVTPVAAFTFERVSPPLEQQILCRVFSL